MKKFFLIFLLILLLGGGWFYLFFRQNNQLSKSELGKPNSSKVKEEEKPQSLTVNLPSPIKNKIKTTEAIFVPEWQLNLLKSKEAVFPPLNQYQRLIYFGDDRTISQFVNWAKERQKERQSSLWFTYKVDKIPDKNAWEEIVKNKLAILKNNQLAGVVLDLEISGLKFDNLVRQINDFVQFFNEAITREGYQVSLAVYGDLFYRKRPYDLNLLVKHSDEIMIMAYDFSKSYGEPGPNFPFAGKEKYGYDFQTMINDFLNYVPAKKLTVIFGLYGYDWQVDEKKRPINQAKALTLNQIKEKFFFTSSFTSPSVDLNCRLENCLIKRDDLSKEVEINYFLPSKTPDEQGVYRLDYHIVWFEDEESVLKKQEFLKSKGINQFSYWAWGYY